MIIKVIRKEGFWHTVREGILLVLSRILGFIIDTGRSLRNE